MDIKVIVQNCTLTQEGNYFMLLQLDELFFSDKDKKSTKFRSEVQFNSSHPSFKKNVFQFSNLSYGNRITLKIGCFNTRLMTEPKDNKKLIEHSILHGTMQLVLTVKILDTLRLEGELKHESLLYDPDNLREEKGRIIITLRHKSHDIKA